MFVNNATNSVSIRDDTWRTDICTGLDTLRRDGAASGHDFCDVTLTTADGACVRAHACVLAAASPYLRALLAASGADCVLRLEAVTASAVRALVAFVYGGAVCMPSVELRDVISAAKQLGVCRLAELGVQACLEYTIQYNESQDNIAENTARENNGNDTESTIEQTASNVADETISEPSVTDGLKREKTQAYNDITFTNTEPQETAQSVEVIASQVPLCQDFASNHPTGTTDVALSISEDNTQPSSLSSERLKVEEEEQEDSVSVGNPMTKCIQLIHDAGGNPVYVRLDLENGDTSTSRLSAPQSTNEATVVKSSAVSNPNKGGLFSCDDCGKEFKKRVYLEEHRRSHTGELYTCNVCSKQFQWRRGLELHARMHTGEKPYGCDVCGHRFAHSSNYSAHMLRHTQARPFVCSTCGERFGSKSSMVRHRRVHKPDDERVTFACDVCERTFTERHLLTKHTRVHTGERTYECKVCARRFTHASSLAYHRWTHKRERPLACEKCGTGFVSRVQLNAHMRTHTGERPYECTYCSRRFSSAANRTVHMRTHTGERPYACLACARCFATSSNLHRHREWHARRAVTEEADIAAGADQKPHQCSVCGKRFAQHAVLMRHEKVHQMPCAEFKCADCDVVFSRVSNLRRHQRTTGHAASVTSEQSGRVTCSTCNATFASSGSLAKHAKKHERQAEMCAVDGRPFACSDCPRRFKSAASLRQHIKIHVKHSARTDTIT